MFMSKYGELILLWDFIHYKDCYKGCGEKSEMGGRGCDVLTLTLNWDWGTHLTL